MDAAILFGNGVNQLDSRCPNWENLLSSLAKDKILEFKDIISATLKFEAIVLNNGNTKKDYSKNINDIKKLIVENFNNNFKSRALQQLAALPVKHYITTNYDNSILPYFTEGFKKIGSSDISSDTTIV